MPFAPVPSKDDYFTALVTFLTSVLPAGTEVDQAQDNLVPSPKGSDYVLINEIGRERLSLNVTTYADCAFAGSVAGAVLTISSVRLGAVLPSARLLGTGVVAGTTILAQTLGPTGGPGTYTLSLAQPTPLSGVPLAAGTALITQPTRITIQVDVYGLNSANNVETVSTLFRDDYASLWFQRQGYAASGIGPLDIGQPRQMAFVDAEQNYEERWTVDLALQVNQVVSPSQDFADNAVVSPVPADIIFRP